MEINKELKLKFLSAYASIVEKVKEQSHDVVISTSFNYHKEFCSARAVLNNGNCVIWACCGNNNSVLYEGKIKDLVVSLLEKPLEQFLQSLLVVPYSSEEMYNLTTSESD